jgi:hypothetical protein
MNWIPSEPGYRIVAESFAPRGGVAFFTAAVLTPCLR